MTGRDRIVLIVVIMLAALGGTWMLLVAPERQKASELDTQVTAARTQLSTAEGALSTARTAQSQYATAYASVVSLGKAVPPSEETASLIYQLSKASNEKNVQLASIVASAGGASSSNAPSTATTALSAFTPMPFTFIFEGGFFDLEHLFHQLTAFTNRTSAGDLQVSGRLLTVQSVKLAPVTATGPGSHSGELAGTISATAYVLPASEGLTGSATPASPTGGAATPASTSTSAASSSTTAPAIVRVNP